MKTIIVHLYSSFYHHYYRTIIIQRPTSSKTDMTAAVIGRPSDRDVIAEAGCRLSASFTWVRMTSRDTWRRVSLATSQTAWD